MNNQSTTFSSISRAEDIKKLQTQHFDLVIIGGGATGCGIALDAASRGMKVALVEKEDFASGTSSKSTKLIHGGLRYLKQLEIGLVRETGTERAIVHKLAPHLVLPEKMILPITENGTYGKWAASFGVMVYDLVAGVEKEDRRKMLSKQVTLTEEPLIKEENLKGSCFYSEYRTDDARLTIELIKRAQSYGATSLNYCKATEFIYNNNKVEGIVCNDKLSNESFVVKAKQIVSAGGPWVDKLRTIDNSKKGSQLHLTKGVHIVFPHDKFPLTHSVYFDNSDGRMIFAIPRGKITYVGTTDTTYKGSLDRVVATKSDADYIISAINQAFKIKLVQEDIISNWAGLRPLIHEEGKSPSELSRKDEIFESPTGLISIAGGKLTGYRKMAQRIVDLVEERLPATFEKCKTREISIVKDTFKDAKDVENYIQSIEVQLAKSNLEPYYSWYLVTNYGKQTNIILNKMSSFPGDAQIALARAEAWFGIHHEMVNRLEDYFVRRSGRLYFDIKSIPTIRDIVASDMQEYLKWDDSRLKLENETLDLLIHDASHYPKDEIALISV